MTLTRAPLTPAGFHDPGRRRDRGVYLCGVAEQFTRHLARNARVQFGWAHVTGGHVLIEASVLYHARLHHLRAWRPPGGPFTYTWEEQTRLLDEPHCDVQDGRAVRRETFSYLITPSGDLLLR